MVYKSIPKIRNHGHRKQNIPSLLHRISTNCKLTKIKINTANTTISLIFGKHKPPNNQRFVWFLRSLHQKT